MGSVHYNMSTKKTNTHLANCTIHSAVFPSFSNHLIVPIIKKL